MAKRIAARLFEMSETLDDAGRGTGTEVMVIKNQKLDDHYEGLGFPKAVQRKQKVYREGAIAGAKAGDSVALHRPVSDTSGPLAITAM